jgi:hypothetical protein
MKLTVNSGLLHWRLAQLVERTGKVPLMLAMLPCCLLAFWLSVSMPQTSQQQQEVIMLRQQLHDTLPLDQQQPALQNQLSLNQYQQVRLVFEQLQKNNLLVESSRYQLEQQGENKILRLDIPLKGEYLPLVQALDTLSRTLPIYIDQLSMQRPTPATSQLKITLRLRLQQEAR